jgi:D-alanine-D-alanine ligase
MSGKMTVAVLFGGQSGEHEVSLVSSHAIMTTLDPARYEVLPVGITRAGRWLAGAGAHAALVATADPTRLPAGVPLSTEVAGPVIEDFDLLHAAGQVDVVFPVLHGPMGEDGTVQGLLELAGLPYVGCGVAASAVGMDKALMKAAFAAVGLPLLPWLLVRRVDLLADGEAVCARVEAALRYPVFVKPANMGSSVGVSKAALRPAHRRGAGHPGARNRGQCARQRRARSQRARRDRTLGRMVRLQRQVPCRGLTPVDPRPAGGRTDRTGPRHGPGGLSGD